MIFNANHKGPVNDILFLSQTDPLLNDFNNNILFYFSKYEDLPGDYGRRIVIEVSKKDLTFDTIEKNIKDLKKNEELSILSLIKINGVPYHFAMIDFLAKKRSNSTIQALNKTCEFWDMMFNVYNSGRSIHAYGTKLLTQSQWVGFMGYLILLNEKSGEKVVDSRWVGHRLMSGYSSLRITNNSGKYKTAPIYIGSSLSELSI